jgi:hypothetical protein
MYVVSSGLAPRSTNVYQCLFWWTCELFLIFGYFDQCCEKWFISLGKYLRTGGVGLHGTYTVFQSGCAMLWSHHRCLMARWQHPHWRLECHSSICSCFNGCAMSHHGSKCISWWAPFTHLLVTHIWSFASISLGLLFSSSSTLLYQYSVTMNYARLHTRAHTHTIYLLSLF